MARYNTFTYDNALYGFQAEQPSLSWGLDIDWDNDGLYSGENEALRMRKLTVSRGRRNFMRLDGKGFESVPPGEFVIILDNSDGRYDPFNATSPLYPDIAPGCRFRLRVADNATGVIYPVIAGRITDIRPLSENSEWVTIRGVDGLQTLKDTTVYTDLYTTLGIEEAIGYVLAQSGWDGEINLDETTEYINYWWAGGKSAYQEIDELAQSAIGKFFACADGTARLLARNSLPSTIETLTESDIQAGIAVLQPWDTLRNQVRIRANTRVAQTSGEMWRLRDTPLIATGGSLTVWASYAYNNVACPANNVIVPTSGTDYSMNTNADGSGTDLTSGFTVSADLFADSAKLTVVNNSGSDGYITLLKVRGDAIPMLDTTTLEAADTASIGRFGYRTFELDRRWLQDVNFIVDAVDYLLLLLATPRAFPTVRIKDAPALQFAPDLFDRVELDFPSKSISGLYNLARIEHETTNASGNTVLTTFQLEPSASGSGSFWIFPATFDTDTIFSF